MIEVDVTFLFIEKGLKSYFVDDLVNILEKRDYVFENSIVRASK